MGKVEVKVAAGEFENGRFKDKDSKKIAFDSKVHGRDAKDKAYKKTGVIDMER